ncbi:hypothetical protein BDV59DRAFT_43835 [Aspergillus ambiguus]|uniref:uncharacterized protein n=1 Tax=Aspergillus ambiguus TaxID=176160 RepID=UPI003CCD0063
MDITPDILVHIAAPSSLHDDLRYRAQVAALLNFQSAVPRQPITTLKTQTQTPSSPSANPAPHVARSLPAGSEPLPQPPCPPPDAWDDSPVSEIPDSQPSPPPASSPEGKRPRTEGSSSGAGEDTHQQPQDALSQRQTQTQPLHLHLPLQIHSPMPPISSAAFTTHITPTLSMLATRLQSARSTYAPQRQFRALDPLERGYWRVSLTLVERVEPAPSPNTWDAAFFSRFWAFLAEFVSEQRAGWGAWCLLQDGDGDRNRDHDHDLELESASAPFPRNVVLKVYAWGEVAMHIYLLLFLASERRIRKMGAQWRDGRDEVVVQMPSGTG